jgi:hypothetical protein
MCHGRVALLAAALCLALCLCPPPPATATASEPAPPVLHVVLFSWNPGMSAADEAEFLADSRRLLVEIPGVQEVRGGRKAADQRDAHVKDYDVAVSVRLRSLADLASYGSHPRHVELLGKWKPRILRTRVVDFFGE